MAMKRIRDESPFPKRPLARHLTVADPCSAKDALSEFVAEARAISDVLCWLKAPEVEDQTIEKLHWMLSDRLLDISKALESQEAE